MTRREVVDLLIAARRAKGLGQRTLSALLGYSPTLVWRWENGRGGPSAEKALWWMEFLGVSPPPDVDLLFGGVRCGTRAGYARHRRRGEVCPACCAGYAAYMREWRQGRAA